MKNDYMENYNQFEEIINKYNLSGIDVLQILLDWHGTYLLSDDFMDNLKNCEGYEL